MGRCIDFVADSTQNESISIQRKAKRKKKSRKFNKQWIFHDLAFAFLLTLLSFLHIVFLTKPSMKDVEHAHCIDTYRVYSATADDGGSGAGRAAWQCAQCRGSPGRRSDLDPGHGQRRATAC